MSNGRIAISMPGKMGDALYALPTARYLYGVTGKKIDFYTSSYCLPMKRLVEYQPYIHEFIIPDGYIVERMDMGVQPWNMPIPNEYDEIHQLGFRGIPDTMLHQYMAKTAGITAGLAIAYDYPRISNPLGKPYIAIAPRGDTTYNQLFNDIADLYPSIIIGGNGDYLGHGVDMTGKDMLDTLSLLDHATAFIGLMSSQLVLANGFNIPRIAPHDGIHWDMSHVVQYHLNHYPINPTVADIKHLLDSA